MKISRKSWHYRYLDWIEALPITSLCVYFWVVVITVLFAWFLVPAFLLINKSIDFFDSEPGLFRLWWRAHKEGICPFIDFVD